MCVSCGELITITDIYPDGECGYYYIELTVPQAAVTLTTDTGSIQNLGGGLYLLYQIPCGESVTIQLINDQSCISASKTITYACCGADCMCNLQYVTMFGVSGGFGWASITDGVNVCTPGDESIVHACGATRALTAEEWRVQVDAALIGCNSSCGVGEFSSYYSEIYDECNQLALVLYNAPTRYESITIFNYLTNQTETYNFNHDSC